MAVLPNCVSNKLIFGKFLLLKRGLGAVMQAIDKNQNSPKPIYCPVSEAIKGTAFKDTCH